MVQLPLSARAPVAACLLSLAALAPAARAQAVAPPPVGVLNLQATASVEVANDLLSVTLAATREGPDAASVQSALKQALDAALTEARKAARPGQVEVQAGNFSLYPRYGTKGGITGWQGSASLVVEGRDLPAIAQLTGRLSTVAITRVGYGLSREAREKVEADVTAQAIARYRAKASEIAKQFGHGGYAIREVNVSTNEPSNFAPAPMMMRAKSAVSADESLPVEPGKGTVTATVNGSVQMK
jgi:predicted secreted protein